MEIITKARPKRLLALLMVFAMVATFASTSFAAVFEDVPADHWAYEFVEGLHAKDIIGGYEDGTFGLNDNLRRGQAAKMIAIAAGLDYEGKEAEFSDVPEGHENSKYIAALVEAGAINGFPDDTFKMHDNITRRQIAQIVAKAFDLTEGDLDVEFTDIDFAGGEYIEILASNGIVGGYEDGTIFRPNNNVTRGQFAKIVTLAMEAAESAELEVVEVSAINLKSLVIEFNKDIDEDTIENIKVEDKTIEVELLEDKQTVVVVFETALDQSEEIEITIDGLKSVDEDEIEDYETKLTVNDTDIPTLDGAAVLNHKEIELFFSEPVNFERASYQVLNNIKIGGTSVISKATPNHFTNSIILEFATLLEDGEHTIEVSGIKDYAGFQMVKTSYDVVVIEDNDAPTITNVETRNVNTLRVTFDEKVATQGSFKVNGVEPRNITSIGNYGRVFDLELASALDLSAVVEVKVEYKGQKDVAGNEVKEWATYSFKLEDDTTLPSVSFKIEKGNEVTLTFSKTMATNKGTITVLDKDNKAVKTINVIPALFKEDTNNAVIELDADDLGLNNKDEGEYTLRIKDMEDSTVRKNLLPEQNIKFTSFDTKAPTVTETYHVTEAKEAKNDTITFYFSEAMDKDSVVNLSNYVVVDGSSFAEIADVKVKAFAADGKSVEITYPNAREFDGEVRVRALEDVAGNMMSSSQDIRKLEEFDIVINSVLAKTVDKIEVNVTTKLSSVDPSVFYVEKLVDGDWETYSVFTSVSLNAAGTKATFTLNKNISSDAYNYRIVLNEDSEKLIKNVYGETLEDKSVEMLITDEIAPEVKSIKQKVVDGDKALNRIEVEFTEDVSNPWSDIVVLLDGKVFDNFEIYSESEDDLSNKIEIIVDAEEEDVLTFSIGYPAPRFVTDARGNVLKTTPVQELEVEVEERTVVGDANRMYAAVVSVVSAENVEALTAALDSEIFEGVVAKNIAAYFASSQFNNLIVESTDVGVINEAIATVNTIVEVAETADNYIEELKAQYIDELSSIELTDEDVVQKIVNEVNLEYAIESAEFAGGTLTVTVNEAIDVDYLEIDSNYVVAEKLQFNISESIDNAELKTVILEYFGGAEDTVITAIEDALDGAEVTVEDSVYTINFGTLLNVLRDNSIFNVTQFAITVHGDGIQYGNMGVVGRDISAYQVVEVN